MPTTKPVAARKTPSPRATSFDPEAATAFGRVVRHHREKRGLAQDSFAFKAGIDRSYFGKLERGERQPTFGLMFRIAKCLDMPLWKLVRDAETYMAELVAAGKTRVRKRSEA